MRRLVSVAARLASVMLAGSCTGPARRAQAPPAPPDAAPVPPAAATTTPCGDLAGCRVLEEHDAGRDGRGRTLSVALLALGDAPDGGPGCERQEQWLVARAGGAIVERTRLLAVCNDGYGAAGLGEDAYEVRPDWFLHRQHGGSSWRWTESLAIGLAPLRRRLVESDGSWTLGPNFMASRWSWDDFAGRLVWFAPACDEAEKDTPGGGDADVDAPPPHAYAYEEIPRVRLEPAYRDGGWRTTELGGCAARIDGVTRGFAASGKPDGAADASLRVVAGEAGDLFVEVRDDKLVGPSSTRWLADDHLELWVSRDPLPTFDSNCLEKQRVDLRQWAVRVTDGAVFPAHGKPAAADLGVERAADGDVVRFHLKLPADVKALAVVYSDSDGGKRQEWLLATSRLRFGKQATLGAFMAAAPEDATCRIAAGKLEPDVHTAYKPEEP